VAKQTALNSPPVNLYEANDQLTVAIPIPGAHHDTTEVVLAGRKLIVRAEPRYPQEQQHYLRHEWSVGTSHREVDLPKPVRSTGAKAMLTHGILTISLPIGTEPTSARTTIPVSEPTSHLGQSH
jgi:HSP20 family molecular chaperone IbpA